MIVQPDIDQDRAKIWTYYLLRATRKCTAANIVKEKYERELSTLTRETAFAYHTELDLLRARTQAALAREKAYLQEQKADAFVADELQRKMKLLSQKLERVTKTREGRKRRIQELDTKVESHHQKKIARSSDTAYLNMLEGLYDKLKGSSNDSSRLKKIKSRIALLRKKLQKKSIPT